MKGPIFIRSTPVSWHVLSISSEMILKRSCSNLTCNFVQESKTIEEDVDKESVEAPKASTMLKLVFLSCTISCSSSRLSLRYGIKGCNDIVASSKISILHPLTRTHLDNTLQNCLKEEQRFLAVFMTKTKYQLIRGET